MNWWEVLGIKKNQIIRKTYQKIFQPLCLLSAHGPHLTYWGIFAGRSIHRWCRFCENLLPRCGTPDMCIALFHCDCIGPSWGPQGLHFPAMVESDSLLILQECGQRHNELRRFTSTQTQVRSYRRPGERLEHLCKLWQPSDLNRPFLIFSVSSVFWHAISKTNHSLYCPD